MGTILNNLAFVYYCASMFLDYMKTLIVELYDPSQLRRCIDDIHVPAPLTDQYQEHDKKEDVTGYLMRFNLILLIKVHKNFRFIIYPCVLTNFTYKPTLFF